MKDRKRGLLPYLAGTLPYAGQYLFQGSIHSPEIFSLRNFLSSNSIASNDVQTIRSYRQSLLQEKSSISFEHPYLGLTKRRICDIAKKEGKRHRSGQLLYLLVKYFKPKLLLETGTSLGLSLLYQSLAMEAGSKIISLEGAPELLNYTRQHLPSFEHANIILKQARVPQDLEKCLQDTGQVDWVFLDADHNGRSIMEQMEIVMQYLHEDSVVLIDDIRWSEGMYEVWKSLCTLPRISHGVDFFDMGLLMFRENTQQRTFYLLH